MIDAVGASPHNVFVAAMLERALLAPGHGCVRCVGLPTSRERWGAAIYVQLRRSETPAYECDQERLAAPALLLALGRLGCPSPVFKGVRRHRLRRGAVRGLVLH